jgi:hypothetical protein
MSHTVINTGFLNLVTVSVTVMVEDFRFQKVSLVLGILLSWTLFINEL